MEPEVVDSGFSYGVGAKTGEMGFGLEEIHGLIGGETQSSSFTALLELPPPQAVELLVKGDLSEKSIRPPFFPSNAALIDRASTFSVFASADNSLESTAILSAVSSAEMVKQEPLDSNSYRNSSSPAVSNQSLSKRKQVREPNRKRKKTGANEANDENGEKLPYVHVRARRGQATDSHSLAERARREKINARMKLLQELVPGCNKISGTALVLDEIINHVQTLQRQVEFLSMRLAAVDPRVDFNLECLLAAEMGTSVDNSHSGFFAPGVWLENPMNLSRQLQQYPQPLPFDEQHHHPSVGREQDLSTSNFLTPENSLPSYGSPSHSASRHSGRLKSEL